MIKIIKMNEKVTWYSDCGHAWLRVKTIEASRIGILNKVSSFSFCKGKYIYLEEDCDARLYLEYNNLEARQIERKSCNGNSKIRSYDKFSVETAILNHNLTR
jgi:hypothetical protein